MRARAGFFPTISLFSKPSHALRRNENRHAVRMRKLFNTHPQVPDVFTIFSQISFNPIQIGRRVENFSLADQDGDITAVPIGVKI